MKNEQINKIAEAFRSLQIDTLVWEGTELVDAKISPTVFEREGRILISGEDFAISDYYGEYRGGSPWISEKLEALADELGVFIEWQDPGTLSVCL